jgi:hypothetical protein
VSGEDSPRTRYLLGQLPEAEQEAVEREYFESDEAFERLEEADQDLIDSYVAGTLEPAAAARLRESLAGSPARRARVEFAAALRELARRERTLPVVRRAPGPIWASLAAVLAVGLLGSLWSQRALRQERDAARSRADAHEARATRLEADAALAREATSGIGTLVVPPGLERDVTALPTVTRRDGMDWIRLRLVLGPDASEPAYAATLETVDGRKIAGLRGLRVRSVAASRVIDTLWPAAELSPGHYVVVLRLELGEGTDATVEAYTFRVVAQE